MHRVQPPNSRLSCKYPGRPLISRACRQNTDDGLWNGRGPFSVLVRVRIGWETCPAAVIFSVTASGVVLHQEREKDEYGPDWEGEGQMRRRPIRISREIVAGKKG